MPLESTNLSNSLEIIYPYLSSDIVLNESRLRIHKLASHLPPIYWAGFEIRLSEKDNTQVDFHQGIRSENNNPKVLLDYLEKTDYFSESVKKYLHKFSEQWCNTSTKIGSGILYVVLEFDVDLNSNFLTPAFFITFKDNLSKNERYLLTKELLEIFELSSSKNLDLCFNACNEEEFISHIGIMLSRKNDIIRLNIRNVSYNRIKEYLEKAGYEYPTKNIEDTFSKYIRYLDRVILCLDVGNKIYPRVGLECTIIKQPYEKTGYNHFFNKLIKQNLCSSEKAKSLLHWSNWLTPVSNLEQWPEYLLVESLLKPANEFNLIDRTLSHIKIDCFPDNSLKTKAYIGYEYCWHKKENIITEKRNYIKEKDFEINEILDNSINKAIEFLLKSRIQGGWWREYNNYSFPGTDEWMTGYLGYILSTIPNEKAMKAAKQAWELLKQCERSCGGWGWSYFTPSDADSTSWVLKLAHSLKSDERDIINKAFKFMQNHQNENGGLATYEIKNFVNFTKNNDNSKELQDSTDISLRENILKTNKDWFYEQPCITSAASNIQPIRSKCLKFLYEKQEDDGRWQSLWWPGCEFSTALAVESLANYGNNHFDENISKAVKWAESKIGEDGSVYSELYENKSPFATASCLKILLHKKGELNIDKIEKSIRWLLVNQKENGAWVSSALMYHPEKTQTDDKSIHTTASILNVLNIYRNYRKLNK